MERSFNDIAFLILDKNNLDVRIITQMINSVGFNNYYIANDGAIALDLYYRHNIDIVICDVNLSSMSGEDLFETLLSLSAKSDRKLKFLFCSRMLNKPLIERSSLLLSKYNAFDCCQLDFVIKPVRLPVFVSKLQRYFMDDEVIGNYLRYYLDEIDRIEKNITEDGVSKIIYYSAASNQIQIDCNFDNQKLMKISGAITSVLIRSQYKTVQFNLTNATSFSDKMLILLTITLFKICNSLQKRICFVGLSDEVLDYYKRTNSEHLFRASDCKNCEGAQRCYENKIIKDKEIKF
jgi:CheY-like chemotaxis protein